MTTRVFNTPGMQALPSPLDTTAAAPSEAAALPALPYDCLVSPLAAKLPDSFDARFQKHLTPQVSNPSVLKPRNFYALCEETHNALTQEAQTRSESVTPEAQESVKGLLALLEENMALRASFQNSMNLVKKV